MAQKDPQKLPACSIPVKLTTSLHSVREWMHKTWGGCASTDKKRKTLVFKTEQKYPSYVKMKDIKGQVTDRAPGTSKLIS